MKFSFRSFAIGFGCAALSLGAVTYANAAGNKTLKACANKTTGVMRYISKGSCKKTETLLSWSQMGPQGLPGSAGEKGDTGAAGTNGTNGTNGSVGADGRRWDVVDKNGKVMGDYISYIPSQTPVGGGITSSIVFLSNGIIFQAQTNRVKYMSTGGTLGSYFTTNTLSREPLAFTGLATTGQDTFVSSSYTVSSDKVFKTVGEPQLFTGAEVYGASGSLLTTQESSNLDSNYRWIRVEEIVPPTYTAPLRIVAK